MNGKTITDLPDDRTAGQMKQSEDGAVAEAPLASVNGKTITDLPGDRTAGQMKQT